MKGWTFLDLAGLALCLLALIAVGMNVSLGERVKAAPGARTALPASIQSWVMLGTGLLLGLGLAGTLTAGSNWMRLGTPAALFFMNGAHAWGARRILHRRNQASA